MFAPVLEGESTVTSSATTATKGTKGARNTEGGGGTSRTSPPGSVSMADNGGQWPCSRPRPMSFRDGSARYRTISEIYPSDLRTMGACSTPRADVPPGVKLVCTGVAASTCTVRGCSGGSCPGFFPDNFHLELLDGRPQRGRALSGVASRGCAVRHVCACVRECMSMCVCACVRERVSA